MDNKREPRKPEEEIRELIEQYGSLEEAGEQADQTVASEEDAAETGAEETLFSSQAEEFPLVMPVEEDAPARGPRKRRSVGQVLLSMVEVVVPHVGDGALEVVRKCVFVLALLTLVGSLSYLANDMVILPAAARDLYAQSGNKYNPDAPVSLPEELENFDFLPGMDDSFKLLYTENTDLRGFITYKSNKANDFLKINLPIVRGIDNAYYLKHDFHKNETKYGCLFFDMRNTIETLEDHNKSLIIYGHNMATGDMFAGLNKFIGSLSNVRSAPLITMNTVFEEAQYKVFAIAVMDESEGNEARYYYTRTGDDFSSDKEFLRYIDEIRARSMWDFEKAVDVQADDDILILSTCTAESAVHFDDGRLAVFARKVRPGESADVAVNKIKANDDVIMPLAWYVNQKKEPHPYYTENGYTIPSTAETEGSATEPAQTTPATKPAPTDSAAPTTASTKPAPTKPTPTKPAPTTTPKPTPPETTTQPSQTQQTDPPAPPVTEPPATDPPETQPQETEATQAQETEPTQPDPVAENAGNPEEQGTESE